MATSPSYGSGNRKDKHTLTSKKSAPNRSRSKQGKVSTGQSGAKRGGPAKHGPRHYSPSTGSAAAGGLPPSTSAPVDPNLQAALRLRYGGQEAALAQRQASIDPWFHQFQVGEAARAAAQQGLYAGLQQQNQLAQQQAAQGPQLGPGVSADVQAQSQQAGLARQNLQAGFGQALGLAGAANSAYQGGLASSAGAAQLNAQLQTSRDRSQLAADKGAYAVQYQSDQAKAAR